MKALEADLPFGTQQELAQLRRIREKHRESQGVDSRFSMDRLPGDLSLETVGEIAKKRSMEASRDRPHSSTSRVGSQGTYFFADARKAERYHENVRSERAQRADERLTASRLTTDVEEWMEHPARSDYPGVDTRKGDDLRGRFLEGYDIRDRISELERMGFG